MTIPPSYKVVTANRLSDGAVVYRAANGEWSKNIRTAEALAHEAGAAERLAKAEQDAAKALVVAPYLIEVAQTNDGLVPTTLRERIRAAGPTIHAASL